MFNFFNSLGDLIGIVIDYIVSFFSLLVSLPVFIANVFVEFALIFKYMPDVVAFFGMIVITLAIVLQILNKGG